MNRELAKPEGRPADYKHWVAPCGCHGFEPDEPACTRPHDGTPYRYVSGGIVILPPEEEKAPTEFDRSAIIAAQNKKNQKRGDE